MIPAVERYFEFVQRTVDISRDFTPEWVEAGNPLTGVAREQAESVSGLLRDQAQSASGLVHEKARERYEGKTKAELSDLLDRRNLPKTGNTAGW
jgi:hypothetical protein